MVMNTRTVGQLLREERSRRQLSLDALSKKTRIRLEYLQALEANEFALLPAATFVKGYIKRYAAVLGLDHKPLLALLRRDYKESAKGTLVPREFIKPVLKSRRAVTSVTLVMALMASVFVALISYVGFQWYQLNKPPELTVAQPAEQANVSAQIVVEGQTSAEAIVNVNNQPVSLRPDGSFSSTIFIPNEGITTITVEAADRRGKTNRIQRTVYVQF